MKLLFKIALVLFALISFTRPQVFNTEEEEHHCDHDKHQSENPPEFLDVEEDYEILEDDDKRVLAARTYPKIRIYADYSYLAKTSSSSYTSYIQRNLAPAVIAYFQSALKVKYPVSGKLKAKTKTLCGMAAPSILKNGVFADFAIMFSSRSENSNVVATSKYCNLANGSRRPVIGTTNFNRKMFKVANGDVILHEKNTYTLLHEMMHILGFSNSIYRYFLSPTGKTLTGHIKSLKIAGKTHTVVNVPALTNKVRRFHGCSTIPGAIMENNGGSGTDGSHFDKKFYAYEVMSSGSQSGKRISQLSLSVLEASGWYVIDYSYAEPYFYGQGQGCGFINGQCSATKAVFEEFCTGNKRRCSSMGHSGGFCASDSKMDGCKFVNPSNSYNCEIASARNNARLKNAEVYGRGTGSRCFTGTLNTKSSTSTTSFCFKYNCVKSGLSTRLQVILGSKVATCKKEGKMSINGYYGTLDCPDPVSFCGTIGKKYCPRNCMGRGKCVGNKCHCNKGFKGIDCALRT